MKINQEAINIPNWATGELYISGETQDVKDFLEKGIEGFDKSCGDTFGYDTEQYYHYIRNTERCFMTEREIDTHINNGIMEACLYVECAWDIDVDGFTEISKKYNIGIGGAVTEPNMGFEHEIDIRNGDLYFEEVRDYSEDSE